MKLFLILFTSFLFFQCGSDNETQKSPVSGTFDSTESMIETIPPEKELEPFVLDGYEILEFQKGDLNKDGLEDCLLALNQIQEDTVMSMEDAPKRPLIILIRNSETHSLEQIYRNDNAIYCYSCGGIFGDPFPGMEITENGFVVYHYGGSAWRWTHDLFFSFQESNQNYTLDSIQSAWFHAAEPDSTYELKTEYRKDFGEVYFQEYNIYLQE